MEPVCVNQQLEHLMTCIGNHAITMQYARATQVLLKGRVSKFASIVAAAAGTKGALAVPVAQINCAWLEPHKAVTAHHHVNINS